MDKSKLLLMSSLLFNKRLINNKISSNVNNNSLKMADSLARSSFLYFLYNNSKLFNKKETCNQCRYYKDEIDNLLKEINDIHDKLDKMNKKYNDLLSQVNAKLIKSNSFEIKPTVRFKEIIETYFIIFSKKTSS